MPFRYPKSFTQVDLCSDPTEQKPSVYFSTDRYVLFKVYTFLIFFCNSMFFIVCETRNRLITYLLFWVRFLLIGYFSRIYTNLYSILKKHKKKNCIYSKHLCLCVYIQLDQQKAMLLIIYCVIFCVCSVYHRVLIKI